MEPPAPTHVFSEAALQTPVPVHKDTTPPPHPSLPLQQNPHLLQWHLLLDNVPGLLMQVLWHLPAALVLPLFANTALSRAKSSLKVDLAHFSGNGITCATASVPSTSNLNIIKATLPKVLASTSISIPTSRLFIKVLDIFYFKAGTTIPSIEQKIL
ncbi:hypothetical protein P691DRAFT_767814 [Macrolepiota fuliginosa MF-IS2]|uniref:Uncharacterized protein n=1 Tax=Macrolepiota fuliginosa MF-IS2 TaxID=1400762 RepID=A0A9P5WXQ9_9AGAR|nr:hypothetical protein P691DRAFT_767814 [Macrolepiota fuliginosa MF-IS2]